MMSILRRVEAFSKEEIKDLIAKNYRILDKNLELIGGSLGTRREMLWDLIGVDKEKRLVLIDIELHYTDKILYQILNRLDWAWEHIENITKMHPSYEINDKQMPRVIIVAPSYSPFFKKSISYLNYKIIINIFSYAYLENNAGKSLFLESVETRVQYERVLKSDSKNLKSIEVSNHTKVTTEEIMELLQ